MDDNDKMYAELPISDTSLNVIPGDVDIVNNIEFDERDVYGLETKACVCCGKEAHPTEQIIKFSTDGTQDGVYCSNCA